MADQSDQSFLGRGWAFPPRFDIAAGGVSMVEREQDIHQSLHILFATSPGERVMRPDYGCRLRALVFENLTESAATEIREEIRRAILFFEPRIDLKSVQVTIDDALEGRLLIYLDYVVRSTNSRGNMVYPYYYLEGTHLADVVVPDQLSGSGA